MIPSNLGWILITNIFRYFIVTFGLYFILFYFFYKKKIQKQNVSKQVMIKEILLSMTGLIVLSVSSYLVLNYDFRFNPKIYFNYHDYSFSYHAIVCIFLLFYQDFFFYCIHRLLHTDWFYHKIHYMHHEFTNPTPFTFLAQHPVDLFMQTIGYYLFIFIIPMHPIELVINSAFLTVFNVYGHAGYEFLPKGFTRHPILKYINTSVNHNMHHSHNQCNYGLWFTIWDRVFGTLHPDYDDYYDQVKNNS